VDEPEEVARFTRWETDAEGSRRGVSSFQLSGMHCAACAGIIENALAALDGVHEVRVSASAQRATVHWDPTRTRPSRVVEAVRRAGYEAAPDAALAARDLRQQEHRHTLWRLFVAGFLAMQVMMMATPSYVAAPGELSNDLRQLLNWASWILSVPVLWFAGMPFLRGAWVSLRTRRIGMDVPVALGLLVTFVASTAATFDPAGPFGEEVYFDSLTMFLAFLWLGRFLEMRSRHRAADRLESTAGAMPQTAWRVAEDGSTLQVSLHRLVVGDRVRVTQGSVVPADGELLADGADVSEALITGESAAVSRRRGEDLWAGSLNLGAPFDMRVVKLGADTRHDAIVALMREALSSRPASVRLADRWAGPFLRLGTARRAAAPSGHSGGDVQRAEDLSGQDRHLDRGPIAAAPGEAAGHPHRGHRSTGVDAGGRSGAVVRPSAIPRAGRGSHPRPHPRPRFRTRS